MALIPVGGRIALRDDAQNVGTVGCYVSKHGDPRTVFALTSGHVFKVGLRQAGAVVIGGVPGSGGADAPFGALTAQCTDLRPNAVHSVDAALVAVDPGLVATTLAGTADRLEGFRLAGDLDAGMPVTVLGSRSGARATTILDWDATGAVAYDDPAIDGNRTFNTLVLCATHVTDQGDSGAPVFDAQRKLIGFVLGSVAAPAGNTTPDGLVTALLPAELVLTQFGQYDLLTTVPPEAVAPAAPPPVIMPPAGAAAGLSSADRDTLVRTLFGEASGEPRQGQIAVVHVVRNRVLKRGTDAQTECLRPSQFSCWLVGDPNRARLLALTPADPAYLALATVVDNAWTAADITGGATHYYAPAGMAGGLAPAWSRPPARQTLSVGGHLFFTNVA